MKKVGVLILVFLFAILPFVFANENDTGDEPKSGIENAYSCLEEKAGDCTTLRTQELALTVMATPKSNVFDNCVNELSTRVRDNNWGNVKDTALAIIALQHAGKDVAPYIEWLKTQEKIPDDMLWFIQHDSERESICRIGYDKNDYEVTIGGNKKIDSAAGSCLKLAQHNFWFQVDNKCFEKEFIFHCDEDFIINLLYKNKDSSTIYVLDETKSSPKFNSISTSITSKCFGSGKCEYEATVWSALALKLAGRNIDEYVPYIVAMADSNKNYLPSAFVYMITNYDDYAAKLVSEQRLGSYWQADASSYNRHYDTALAIFALGSSSSEQKEDARGWLMFSQGDNGCWGNSILNTAMILWALEGRPGRTPGPDGPSVTRCTDAGYFCIQNSECPSNEVLGNFHCSSFSTTCCETENLKNCGEYADGNVCSSDEKCVGISRKSLDTGSCCIGNCVEKKEDVNECEASPNYYNCRDRCSDTQEEIGYSCGSGQVCCMASTSPTTKKSLLWLWILLGVLIVGAVFAIIYKDKLKEMIGKKKDGQQSKGHGPGMPPARPGMPPRGAPPRPGFPPVVRQQVPPRRPMPKYKEDPAMRETFRKLRNIATR